MTRIANLQTAGAQAAKHLPSNPFSTFHIDGTARTWRPNDESSYALRGTIGKQPVEVRWNEKTNALTAVIGEKAERPLTAAEQKALRPVIERYLDETVKAGKTSEMLDAGSVNIGLMENLYGQANLRTFKPTGEIHLVNQGERFGDCIELSGKVTRPHAGGAYLSYSPKTGEILGVYQPSAGNSGARQKALTAAQSRELAASLQAYLKAHPGADPLYRQLAAAADRAGRGATVDQFG